MSNTKWKLLSLLRACLLGTKSFDSLDFEQKVQTMKTHLNEFSLSEYKAANEFSFYVSPRMYRVGERRLEKCWVLCPFEQAMKTPLNVFILPAHLKADKDFSLFKSKT